MITRNKLISFFKDETGATAIEYGLIAALVSVAAIAALEAMGTSLISIFTTVQTELTDAAATAGGAADGGAGDAGAGDAGAGG